MVPASLFVKIRQNKYPFLFKCTALEHLYKNKKMVIFYIVYLHSYTKIVTTCFLYFFFDIPNTLQTLVPHSFEKKKPHEGLGRGGQLQVCPNNRHLECEFVLSQVSNLHVNKDCLLHELDLGKVF